MAPPTSTSRTTKRVRLLAVPFDRAKGTRAEAPALIQAEREKGMSQRAIAEKLGMSQSTVQRHTPEDQPTNAGDSCESPASSAPLSHGLDGKTYASPEVIEERREQVVSLSEQGLTHREIAEIVGVEGAVADADELGGDLSTVPVALGR